MNATPSTLPSTIAFPVSAPPWTMLATPSGRPDRISATREPQRAVSSDGFSTIVLPVTKAPGSHAEREGDREVEGRDHAEDPVRLQDAAVPLRLGERSEGHLVAPVLLHVGAVSLDQVDGLLDLSDRLDPRLAGLERDRCGQLDPAVANLLRGLAKERAALPVRQGTPAWLRLPGARERLADESCVRLVRTARDLVRMRGIRTLEHRAVVPLGARDQMAERLA